MPKLLVIDDEPNITFTISETLGSRDLQVLTAGTAREGIELFRRHHPDVVLCDVRLPDLSGLDAFDRMHQVDPRIPVIIMTAFAKTETAIEAMRRGAFEYLVKPVDFAALKQVVGRAIEVSRLSHVPAIVGESESEDGAPNAERIVGLSPAMQEVYKTIGRVASQDATVLILGESGTGKELVARALHDMGRRKDGKFVVINLAAVPRERVEAELFGRDDGDYGKLVEADGGTLFLDEIGDMPLDAQTRLLRVIDGSEQSVNPKTGRPPNVRIIAATNRDLRALIQQGLFREDLFFRLNVAPLRLPPLRDRTEDIPDLARAFLLRANREGLPAKTIDASALERLKLHGWPGNVRELENLIRRICALYGEELITARIVERELADQQPAIPGHEGPVTLATLVERHLGGYFAEQPDGVPPPGLYDRVLEEIERPLIQLTLAATRGNQVRAAEILGLNRNTLRKKIQDLGVEMARGRR